MKKLDMRQGSTTVLILSLLAEGPMYGYQIVKELAARSGGVFEFKEGTLYPALHRMEQEGLVHSYWESIDAVTDAAEFHPPRKYYAITPKGQDALADRAGEWSSFARALLRVLEGTVG